MREMTFRWHRLQNRECTAKEALHRIRLKEIQVRKRVISGTIPQTEQSGCIRVEDNSKYRSANENGTIYTEKYYHLLCLYHVSSDL